MKHGIRNRRKVITRHPGKKIIETSLYNLVEAVSAEVPEANDRMVALIVADILKSARG